MNADFGAPKELAGGLQQRRALYQPRLPPCLQVTFDSLMPAICLSLSLLFPCPRIDQLLLARELILTGIGRCGSGARHPIWHGPELILELLGFMEGFLISVSKAGGNGF